jgi:hypothetical protein
MPKTFIKIINLFSLIIISNCIISQTTTITYTGQIGLSTSACNVFNPQTTVNGITHSSYAGGVHYDATNGISLITTPQSNPKGGTAFIINYNFTPGVIYSISLTAKGNTSLYLNTSIVPNFNQFSTNSSTSCTPDPSISSYSTVGYGQLSARLTSSDATYTIPQFSISGSTIYPYLIIWSSGGNISSYADALSISKITISIRPSITATTTSISCGVANPISFSVTNSAPGITGYLWNLGSSNNGWLYNGNPAPSTINTVTNTLSLTPVCGSALSNISATVQTTTGNYTTDPYTVSITQPILSISGNSNLCSGSSNYTINNLPCNASVSWSVISGIAASLNTSGNIATLTKIGNGDVTLKASVTNSCGINSTYQQVVTVGGGTAPTIWLSNIDNTCGTFAEAYCTNPSNSTGFIWNFNNGVVIQNNPGYYGNYFLLQPLGQNTVGQTYYNTLSVQATNSCGTSEYSPALQFTVGPISSTCGTGKGGKGLLGINPGLNVLKSTTEMPSTKTIKDVSVYPNPAKNRISIEVTSKEIGGSLQIINSSGIVIYKCLIESNIMSVNTAVFPSGVYYAKIISSATNKTLRFVKE